jgi:hypothetical protein
MTLDEAIKHCEDVAAKCFVERSARNHSGKCGFEHLELAAWLRELKAYKEQEPCNSCCGGDQKEKAKLCQKSYLAGLEHRQEPCDDAISRKDALEAILTRVPDFCGGDEGGNLIGRNETASYIRNLPSVTPKLKTGKWIPVSERLPKQGESVICQCRANIIKVFKLDANFDWYQDADHCYMNGFVIAWMPLPEPYKPGSEDT